VFAYRKAITIQNYIQRKLKLPEFEATELNFLHLVDLDGAKSSKIVNYKILNCSQTSLKIDFGGGLKSDADFKIAFESGAESNPGALL
jgi:phosphoribosylformimino-5-aminoimidazole carboxamide ribotide isomerase